MTKDYYAESDYQLIDFKDFEQIISQVWVNIKNNRRIDWNKKGKKFIDNLVEKLHSVILMKLKDQYNLFPEAYIKFFKVFERMFSSRIKDLIIHMLENDIHDKNKTRQIVNEFNIETTLLQVYISFLQKNGKYLNIPDKIKGEIKDLRLDPREIKMEDIKKICNNSMENKVFFVNINFTLKTPYISKDDDIFYFIDNPICKDKVFKAPYVRPGSWKGKLRWVASFNLLERLSNNNFNNWESERCKLVRLFGNEKDEITYWLDQQIGEGLGKKPDEISNQFFSFLKKNQYINKDGNRCGRLIFYPTFLDKYGLDVLAPHKRDTRTIAKTGPIFIETAPEGSEGTFALLYFPFDMMWRENLHEEIMEDLEILKKSIPDMFTKYGFGARTTAGYGLIRNNITFQLFPYSNEIFIDDNFGQSKVSKFIKKIDNLKGGATDQ